MAALTDLISKIQDTELRKKLTEEAKRLSKQKKFGLVFEEHIPECTPLWDIPVKRGALVSRKSKNLQDTFVVQHIDGDNAVCFHEQTKATETIPVAELVPVARFGEAIYPYLKPMDTVCHAPESDLWHTLIEADNYHALQFLEYLYAGKVDCIYIDPPYNTGAKDWKYNNDYVDGNDQYRHSKWLSMMQKRLKIAQKLLNPKDSVLIVTIDEKEYLHLGCLLEEMFPDATLQMISSVINPSGVSRGNEFSRTDEYLFFIKLGSASPSPLVLSEQWLTAQNSGKDKLRWRPMRRQGSHDTRRERPKSFYPIFLTSDGKHFAGSDDALPEGMNWQDYEAPADKIVLWPLKPDGTDGCWQIGQDSLKELCDKGFAKISHTKKWGYVVQYLAEGEQKKVDDGQFSIIGYAEDGSIITSDAIEEAPFVPGTQWRIRTHSAREFGSTLLSALLPKRKFPFPKSLYAIHDTIRFFVANKPNALIVDFFAGSGTTLHAVNLLNAEDGGHRRCVMVTNNEVSSEEAEALAAQGHHPGKPEWEKFGIARYVNWPRTVCSIEGHDINGNALTGEYFTTQKRTVEVNRKIAQIAINGDALSLDAKKSIVAMLKEKIPQKVLGENSHYILSEDYSTTIIFDSGFIDEWLEQLPENPHVEEIYIVTDTKRAFNHLKSEVLAAMPPLTKEEPTTRPMADGFPANAAFFKLGFLDKNAVALGRQFAEMLPTLWMKAGAFGPCPSLPGSDVPDVLILPENHFAVLTEETSFPILLDAAKKHLELETIYIITDYEAGFQRMSQELPGRTCCQLYRDYLDNFRINTARQ